MVRRRAHVQTHLIGRRSLDIRPKNLYPRPVRRRPGFLMATPPKHESALILCQLRKRFSAAGLADPGLPGDEHQLASPGKSAAERSAENLELACPAGYKSMGVPAAIWGAKIAHVDLILQLLLNQRSHQKC